MKRPPGKLRIIGGEHRTRIVDFDAASGVRPTPDRVRQVLFDWLTPVIDGARCLDLFAGSGVLGLEALSRGAAHATLVDTGRSQTTAISVAVAKLGLTDRVTVVNANGLSFLSSARGPGFDVVFVDPPYGGGLLAPTLENRPRVLSTDNRVYLEWPHGKPLVLPAGYTLLREKKAGQVSYGLASFTGVSA